MSRLADLSSPVRDLSRGGLTTFEVDLSDSKLDVGLAKDTVSGYGLRLLRHGSNPGARFELKFSGREAHNFFAPGQKVSGGFDGLTLKRAAGGAQKGKATFAVMSEPHVDLSEDLIISALGPVDLLGKTDANGDPLIWQTIAQNTSPNAAYAAQTGAFDGAGWELLRVLMKKAAMTTASVHFWHNPSWVGSLWFHCGVDGVIAVPDTPGAGGGTYRTFLVAWGGRGVGCIELRDGPADCDFIVQGVK